jgi:hypothetical protein
VGPLQVAADGHIGDAERSDQIGEANCSVFAPSLENPLLPKEAGADGYRLVRLIPGEYPTQTGLLKMRQPL